MVLGNTKPHFTLGVKAKVELKSSIPIDAITEIRPKGFTLGVKTIKENNFLIYHFMALTWPQGKKRYLSTLEANFQLLSQCCAIKYCCFDEIHIVD
jgi:hypothetical protein